MTEPIVVEMSQAAPFPDELEVLVGRLVYKPQWRLPSGTWIVAKAALG